MEPTRPDIIFRYNSLNNLDDIKEISKDDYKYALCYKQNYILNYSLSYSAGVIDINKDKLNLFIENILKNCECFFDYTIEDFTYKTGIATFIYKNNYIYYTMYDDVFSNPFDVVKIKMDDTILHRLKNLPNYK